MFDTLWFKCHNGLELGLSPSKLSRMESGGGPKKIIQLYIIMFQNELDIYYNVALNQFIMSEIQYIP